MNSPSIVLAIPCRRFNKFPEARLLISLALHRVERLSHGPGSQVSRRCHFDRNAIIHGFAYLLAHSAPDTTLLFHHESEGMKIHRKGIDGAFRHTGMTALTSRAEAVRHCRDTHSHGELIQNRHERLRGTGRNAWEIFA